MTERRSAKSHRREQRPVSANDELLSLAVSIGAARIWKGLTSSEIESIQTRFGWRFPPDLAMMLGAGLPAGRGWPDWRAAASGKSKACEEIQASLNWPLKGMLFDIEHDSFWDPQWGEKPTRLDDSFDIARAAFNAAPALIPVFSHRYMPAEPHEAGNPVFSVHQMDIIVYGHDLPNYMRAEAFAAATSERSMREISAAGRDGCRLDDKWGKDSMPRRAHRALT